MLAEIRVTPVGSKVPFARLLAEMLPALRESALAYQVHAMGTTVEGDLDEILDVVRRCHERAARHADRLLIEVSIDDRKVPEGEILRGLDHVREECRTTPLQRL